MLDWEFGCMAGASLSSSLQMIVLLARTSEELRAMLDVLAIRLPVEVSS
jgi:hypothetical protein